MVISKRDIEEILNYCLNQVEREEQKDIALAMVLDDLVKKSAEKIISLDLEKDGVIPIIDLINQYHKKISEKEQENKDAAKKNQKLQNAIDALEGEILTLNLEKRRDATLLTQTPATPTQTHAAPIVDAPIRPATVEDPQENTRKHLALFLVSILAFEILSILVAAFTNHLSSAKEALTVIFDPTIALVGAATGFYFGAHSSTGT